MISPTISKPRAITAYQPQDKTPKKNLSINPTLEGVLVNNHVKENDCTVDFDEVCDSLMISEQGQGVPKYNVQTSEKSFDIKKTLMPLVAGTGVIFGAMAAVSAIYKNRSIKNYDIEKIKDSILDAKKLRGMLPDSPKNEIPTALGININIREEHEFSAYRVLRDPSLKNIKAAAAVFLFSGLAITAKNFVDGAKEIWIKKQEADVERDLQENLIEVETKAFSGKLQVVSGLLSNSVDYFKTILNKKPQADSGEIFFKNHFKLSFTGNTHKEGEPISESKNKKTALYALGALGVLGAFAASGKFAFSNFKKAENHIKLFKESFSEEAASVMDDILNRKDVDRKDILEMLASYLYVKPEALKEKLTNTEWTPEIAQEVTKNVGKIKSSIYTVAPEPLAGSVLEKVQYYCYMNEPRGHLYTWLINPQNTFARNIFMTFAAISGGGYVFKQGMDAVKAVAVASENSKTELDLKKRLVDVEVENFKAKKNSAITPMMENFNYKKQNGKSDEDLKQMAENILFEIKNGPPYVYS